MVPVHDSTGSKEEEEREQKIMSILESFRLQGGPYQTELVMAKSGERLLGTALMPHLSIE